MRFVFFSLRHDPNGGCRLQIDLMNALAERGHEVYYALPFFLVKRPFWTPCLAQRVSAMRAPKMGRFDAAFFNYTDAYTPGYPLTPLVKACDAARRFFVLRSFLPGHIAIARDEKIEKIATSRSMFEQASFYGGPVHKIFGGVNLSRFRPKAAKRPENERPRVLIRDTLDTIKGTATVREALEIVADRGRSFDTIRLGGSERQVREQYCSSDVFVSGEIDWGSGWGSSVAEAMASGCAVACTDTPAVKHIAENEVTALTAPPDEPEAMADAIERLLADADLRRALADAAARRIANYGTERMAEKILRLMA